MNRWWTRPLAALLTLAFLAAACTSNGDDTTTVDDDTDNTEVVQDDVTIQKVDGRIDEVGTDKVSAAKIGDDEDDPEPGYDDAIIAPNPESSQGLGGSEETSAASHGASGLGVEKPAASGASDQKSGPIDVAESPAVAAVPQPAKVANTAKPGVAKENQTEAGTAPAPGPIKKSNRKFPAPQVVPPSSVEKPLTLPTFGQSIAGDRAGTTIRAVSNNGERHQYSRRQAWNSDETIIYVGELARKVSDLSVVRDIRTMMSTEWYPSHKDPDLIYGTSGTKFLRGKVSTGETEVIVDIGETILLGENEGGISVDDRYALVDSNGKLRVIDITNKTVASGPFTYSGKINGGDISQDGEFVVWVSGGTTYVAKRDFSNVVNTGLPSDHGDLCVDANGDQVLAQITGSQVTIHRLKDNKRFSKAIPSSGGGHLSCTNYNRPGWAYLSTYRGGQRLYTVRLDYETQATFEDWGFHRFFLKDYNNYDYNTLPKAAASPSGTQFVYTGDWNSSTVYRDFVLSIDQ